MQYFVWRHRDGRLATAACLVAELTEEQHALTIQIHPPHMETLHQVTPAADGTRLELTYRWPAPTSKKKKDAVRRLMAGRVQASADGYKKLIENAGLGPS